MGRRAALPAAAHGATSLTAATESPPALSSYFTFSFAPPLTVCGLPAWSVASTDQVYLPFFRLHFHPYVS